MFTDERRYEVWEEIRQSDLAAFRSLLPDSLLREAGRRASVKVIKCALCGPNLVWLGIVSAVQHALSFASVLSLTVRMLDRNGRRIAGALPPDAKLAIGEPVKLVFTLSTNDPMRTPKLDSYELEFGQDADAPIP